MKYYYEGSKTVGKIDADNDIDAAVQASNELQKKKETLQLLFIRTDGEFHVVYERLNQSPKRAKQPDYIVGTSIESIESPVDSIESVD